MADKYQFFANLNSSMLQKYVNQIIKNGYTIIPNIISDSECEKYKKLLEKTYDKYSDKYINSKKLVV